MLTDGSRIYFTEVQNGQSTLNQSSIYDGEVSTLSLPSEVLAPTLSDISRDGTKLLLRNHLSPDAEQVLWIVPTTGGVARCFSNIRAHDATWMKDGLHILFAANDDLYIAGEDGVEVKKFASLPGRAFWLRWSPDEKWIRFTLINSNDHTSSLWEISADRRILRPVLRGQWSSPGAECCGSWTPDGKFYVFQSSRGGQNYVAPTTGKLGHKVFLMGLDSRVSLLAYKSSEQQFVPFPKDLRVAGRVEFSRDGQWLAWIKPEDGSLWRSRADGRERMLLSTPPLEVFLMHWSPDNAQIAIMARQPGMPWKIYLLPTTGGEPHPLMSDVRNQADPDWSPDGKLLVFGRTPDLMAEELSGKSIYLFDLQNGNVSSLPGSAGFFSPHWSLDGRYIAAISEHGLMLFDVKQKTWRLLANKVAADPAWSGDGRAIYFHAFMDAGSPIYKVFVESGRLERVAGFERLKGVEIADYSFTGLAPGDVPLVRARISTANIYSFDLD